MKIKILTQLCIWVILNPLYIFANNIDRPNLISEKLFSYTNYTREPRYSLLWGKRLLELKIPNFKPYISSYNWRNCNYKNALLTLNKIQSEFGKDSNYLKFWAENQNRVLLSCEGESSNLLIKPKEDISNNRLLGDYLYQLGSWHFYKKEYGLALENYKKVENILDSPQRPLASYMVARTLAYLDKAEESYSKIGMILEDSTLKDVHDISKDYRFVIMSNSRSYDLYLTKKLSEKHLLWLQEVVQLKPEDIQNLDISFSIQENAFKQLNYYFPLFYDGNNQVDWWISDKNLGGTKMQAVQALAPNNPFIDWMQAKWAYNVFDYDWLWALHEKDKIYWKQNKNIVNHVFQRWENTHNGVWLQIAIQRVHPQDELSNNILEEAEPYLDTQWKNETLEYRTWLFNIWKNIIRINLGKGDIKKVELIISKYWDNYSSGDGLLYSLESANYIQNSRMFKSVLNETLRWLVYTNRIKEARNLLEIMKDKIKDDFFEWKSLLATNFDEATKIGYMKDLSYSFRDYSSNNLWAEMLNLLPIKVLYTLAINENINLEYRAFIARTIFTRVVLLDYENDMIDKYAALVAKLNPSIRELILKSTANHDKNKYIEFLLKMPRFRPTVFLEYTSNNNLLLNSIDVYNHNDNNWWCRFDDKMLNERIFDKMKIIPRDNEIFSYYEKYTYKINQSYRKDLESYLNNQKKLLLSHPYIKLVDEKEINKLKNIPSAPKYLSEAIIKNEKSWLRFFDSSEEKNTNAANLHRAVRTTRYGCKRNGSHGVYSQKAFKLLHEHYGSSPWAKATPYWFDKIEK